MKITIEKNTETKVLYLEDSEKNSALLKKLVILLEKKANPSDIIDRSEYVAVKVWLKEDIEQKLKEMGFAPSPKNVKKVSNLCGMLSVCTDGDWCIIENVINDLAKLDKLDK